MTVIKDPRRSPATNANHIITLSPIHDELGAKERTSFSDLGKGKYHHNVILHIIHSIDITYITGSSCLETRALTLNISFDTRHTLWLGSHALRATQTGKT
jgi:hypothetical protein